MTISASFPETGKKNAISSPLSPVRAVTGLPGRSWRAMVCATVFVRRKSSASRSSMPKRVARLASVSPRWTRSSRRNECYSAAIIFASRTGSCSTTVCKVTAVEEPCGATANAVTTLSVETAANPKAYLCRRTRLSIRRCDCARMRLFLSVTGQMATKISPQCNKFSVDVAPTVLAWCEHGCCGRES